MHLFRIQLSSQDRGARDAGKQRDAALAMQNLIPPGPSESQRGQRMAVLSGTAVGAAGWHGQEPWPAPLGCACRMVCQYSRLYRLSSKNHEEVLPTMTMPCPLCVGEGDGGDAGAKPCDTPTPHVTFVSWPGLNQQRACASDLVRSHVTKFLSTVHPS